MNWSISLLFVWVLFAKSCCGEEFYVTAFPNGVPCPSYAEICHNISFYSAQANDIGDNTEIIFLEGTHQLPSEGIVIQNVVNVTLRGVGNGSASVLQCSESGGIVLAFTEYLKISRLTLKNCGTASHLNNLVYVASLAIYYSLFVEISSVTMENSIYNGLVFGNVLNINISKSIFTRNAGPVLSNSTAILGLFQDSADFAVENGFVHLEENSLFSNTHFGLTLTFSQQSYLVNCTIKSSSFKYSKTVNIIVSTNHSCLYNLEMDQIVSSHSQAGIDIVARDCISKATPFIAIMNSVISYNTAVGVSVLWLGNDTGILSITSTDFFENVGIINSALAIQQAKQRIVQNGNILQVLLKDLRFQQNKQNLTLANTLEISEQVQYTVSITTINIIEIVDCIFTDNIGSAIFIYNSAITFSGTNIFMNNSGVNGGGLYIANNGLIFLSLQSQLIFSNNHAVVNGGAIFVQQLLTGIFQRQGSTSTSAYCFYQLSEPITQLQSNRSDIFVFINNTAGGAGSTVYGGLVDNCISISALTTVQEGFFSNISSFVNQTGDSVISSSSRAVCFCSNELSKCSETNRTFASFPGEVIEFSVVLVGELNGYTSGIVQIASSSSVQSPINLNLKQSCTQLSYTVLVDNSSVTEIIVDLTVAEIEYDLFQRPLILNVTIIPCSEGFQLSDVTGKCECLNKIADEALCFPSSQLIQRSGDIWIGQSDIRECTIVSSDCYYSYCNADIVNITATDPDVQCIDNRAGQLCGRCRNNFSLVLGSNACKDCSNNAAVLMVLPIGLLGICLVALILFINLTVSIGTINGLIFFANIVKLYEPFFPIQFFPFLNQFISWINLDMGIETCFYDGMNALVKVGLQFLFPIYLWLIVVVVIIASKRSSRIARFTGNNTIPVLATVILLSYTKLLRTVITIFSRTPIFDCNNNRYWSIDPTQEYLHGWHILLFVIGIVVMVFLIVPFTLFLLLFPLLELSSGKCRQKLSWFIIRLKPFFDAYRGPYTDLFCFWPGALVVVRIGLALTVALSEGQIVSLAVLFVTMVLLISIYCLGNIYKPGQYIHFLDVGLFIDLTFLSYLVKNTSRDDFTVKSLSWIGTTIILTFAFIVFICVLLYHIGKYSCLRKIYLRILGKKTSQNQQVPVLTTSIINNPKEYDGFSELRESLLYEP